MISRAEILEATLDLLEEAVAVLDEQSKVLFWNKAATALTGYRPEDVIFRHCPDTLYRIDEKHRGRVAAVEDDRSLQRPTLVLMGHKCGHTVPGMLHRSELRDPLGDLTGSVLMFYPVEETDVLPHGGRGEGAGIEHSQAVMEDRLDAAQHQWLTNRVPFGLLWVTVDQANALRRTHGREGCEAMLRTVEQTLLRHLKPGETIGRWGDDEFLVLAHARTAQLLGDHARYLAGLARTAEFRWWGDRVGLTVSIGASHAVEGDSLQSLLLRAREAMLRSGYAGGNQVSEAKGEPCSQSLELSLSSER